jgi:Fe-Mn family superoxide dismutase
MSDAGIDRRQLLTAAAMATAAIATSKTAEASIPAPRLPYAEGALDPVISARTVGLHFGKHHQGYVDKVNELVASHKELQGKNLEQLVKATAQSADKTALFNAAAQAWNHDFYWASLRPKGGGKPTGAIATKIEQDLGGYDAMKKLLQEASVSQFGSGWAWLVVRDGKLAVTKTSNAETPLTNPSEKPLLTIDVWEHAYYLDYQNKRADYAKAVIDKLLNWDFANQNLASNVQG